MPFKATILRNVIGLCLLFLFSCGINKSINHQPQLDGYTQDIHSLTIVNDSTYKAGQNYLLKNKFGQWEARISGDPLERGLILGSLSKPLIDKQEAVFFEKIQQLVPNESKQKLLRKFLDWYNRKMYLHVPEEFKTEIWGVSRYASDKYDFIAPNYLRFLYLHSSHDIGHALQDLALVGCTSFAAWNDKTENGDLILGRNFDFYAGDEFAENKIILFVEPNKGNKFMSVTWGGMIGVVSGMNDKGLTVTINAGKSKIPLAAKDPISLVSREILQYASTIEEAISIAKKREVFVSEAIMVGSAIDGKAALIEVSPNNLGVFEVPNSNELICSNHFQSEAYKDDRRNERTIEESHTAYRYKKMQELLESQNKINVSDAVSILRNKEGLNGKVLGYGNEKAINQLLAHHGIVFKPGELKVWVSSNPYQLGTFVAYDLNEVFKNDIGTNPKSMAIDSINIPADSFRKSEEYKTYEIYRKKEFEIEQAIINKELIPNFEPQEFISLNPNYWKSHFLAGRYLYSEENYKSAINFFRNSLTKEIPSIPETEEVKKFLKKSLRKSR
ncbi:C45 family autoproteolytic acyltransferase/hydolase [Aegicerativicinus sediminis]|uniref:C45 family autoproteolytic acyltransferase/hydolase n=1 Tax=Aegicerativicinus sediminis TaxID=2893202 RepID=UPI001E488441|nr:C45 family peptidase [Aegicerativicinus sediminis]